MGLGVHDMARTLHDSFSGCSRGSRGLDENVYLELGKDQDAVIFCWLHSTLKELPFHPTSPEPGQHYSITGLMVVVAERYSLGRHEMTGC